MSADDRLPIVDYSEAFSLDALRSNPSNPVPEDGAATLRALVEATKVAEATRLPTVTAQQKSEPVWRLENNEPLFIDELTRVVRMTMLEMDYRNVEFISVVADLSINRALVRQAPRPTALVVETATWVEALASVDLATHAEEHARMFTNALRMLRKRGWRALNRMTVQAAQAIYREFYRSELTDLPTE